LKVGVFAYVRVTHRSCVYILACLMCVCFQQLIAENEEKRRQEEAARRATEQSRLLSELCKMLCEPITSNTQQSGAAPVNSNVDTSPVMQPWPNTAGAPPPQQTRYTQATAALAAHRAPTPSGLPRMTASARASTAANQNIANAVWPPPRT
jgi:hypothetical protein